MPPYGMAEENGIDDVIGLDDCSTDQENEEREIDPNLPCFLIVTNLVDEIFEESDEKRMFEEIFQLPDETPTFQYFKSFRRVRVNFTSIDNAATARLQANGMQFCGKEMKCFLTQPIVLGSSATLHLEPPKREKQFLISPPASPPVGWEPIEEGSPILNYDLINAIATLAPGEAHELHPPTTDQPGIIVHICEESENLDGGPRIRIPQTKCPQRSAS